MISNTVTHGRCCANFDFQMPEVNLLIGGCHRFIQSCLILWMDANFYIEIMWMPGAIAPSVTSNAEVGEDEAPKQYIKILVIESAISSRNYY